MAKNQHRNLTGDALHNPKGFDGASNGTKPIKDSAGALDWVTETQLPKALDYVSAQSAPPTEVTGDVYLIDTTGTAYDINTIAWQSGNTIRIAFNGSPDLSAVAADDYFITSGNGNASNDGTFIITTVNDGSDYIEITNNDRLDATDDEATDAVGTGYYTLAEWDAVSKVSHVTFDGSIWSSITPSEGQSSYDVTLGAIRVFDGTDWSSSLSSGGVTGSGTTNYLAKWTPSGSALGNSVIQDNGSTVGINTSPLAETDLTTSRTSAASTASASIKTTISGSNTNTTKGIDITASNTSSGTVWGTITDVSTSGTSNLLGHEVKIDTSGSGTITANAAYYVNQLDAGGTTTVSNAYGLLSDGVGGSGTTTNAYHLYLTAHSSGTNKYGIYQAGANDKNYFAGAMQFDTAAAAVGYVWTATDADGNGDWAAASGGGGGSSLWTDDSGGKISYSAANPAVSIYETGYAPTFGSQLTLSRGFISVGDDMTIGSNATATTLNRGAIFGGTHTVANIGTTAYPFIAGYNNKIEEGDYNIIIGQGSTIFNTTDSGISIGNANEITGNESVAIGSSVILQAANSYGVGKSIRVGNSTTGGTRIGFGELYALNQAYYNKGFYVEFSNNQSSARNSFGLTKATGLAANVPLNMCLGFDSARSDGLGGGSTGAGAGVFWLSSKSGTAPTANFSDQVALYSIDRDGTSNKAGIIIKSESGTKHYFSDFSAIGGDQTVATANKTLTIAGTGTGSGTSSLVCQDSAGAATFEVKDDGSATLDGGVLTPNGNAGITTVQKFNATPDQELYDDGNIEIHLDDAATDDIEVKVLTNPSSGDVQFGWWSPSDTSAGSASLNISDGQTPLNGNFGDDDTMQIRIFAPSDAAYPYWEVNITKGASGDPLVIRVTKWSSYD